MKRIFILGFILFAALSVKAQAAHSVSLSWTASADSTTAAPGTVTVFRATSACTGTPSFVNLAANVAPAGPYSDTTVGIGVFCYYVVSVINGASSLPSNTVQVTVLPSAPTALAAIPH